MYWLISCFNSWVCRHGLDRFAEEVAVEDLTLPPPVIARLADGYTRNSDSSRVARTGEDHDVDKKPARQSEKKLYDL